MTKIHHHEVQPIQNKDVVMCDYHTNQKGVIYCKTCNKIICMICALTSTHQSHETVNIENIKLEIRLKNQELIEKAKKKKDEVFQIYKKMNEDLKKLEKKRIECSNQMKKRFETYYQMLNKREKELKLNIQTK